MPEDYYSDGDASASSAPAPEGGDSSDDSGTTAVVPSELCPGMKVGDKMEVEIVGVDDDSYQIKYTSKGNEEKEPETEVSAPAPEGSMASMME